MAQVVNTTAAALLLLCCLGSQIDLSLAQHGGGSMAAGVMSSQNMTDPCYTNSTAAACAGFRRMHMDWMADLNSLCLAMPFMTACTIWAECKPLLDAKNPATNMSLAFGTFCGAVSLVGDVCVEMPRMKGCEAYKALCAPGTVVEQCLSPGPLPAMIPETGIDMTPAGANFSTPLWTFDVKESVDVICAAEPTMEPCASCPEQGPAFKSCPNPLDTLSKLCAEQPDMPECAGFQAMCANPDVQELIPQLCAGNFTVPEFKPVFASINTTDPCYKDPTVESCKAFRRSHMEWTSDMTSLCNAMPFMVGCTLWQDCKPLLDAKNPATNMSLAFGTFCGMPSLVGAVCLEMPRMKGCEAYLALCGTEGSVVAACKNPGVAPSVPFTYETKAQVDDLCASPEADLDACSACDSEGNVFGDKCPDPLSTLVALCNVEPVPPQCTNLTAMCSTPNVSAVLDTVCVGANGAEVPSPIPSAASSGAALSLATLLLAAIVPALLA